MLPVKGLSASYTKEFLPKEDLLQAELHDAPMANWIKWCGYDGYSEESPSTSRQILQTLDGLTVGNHRHSAVDSDRLAGGNMVGSS